MLILSNYSNTKAANNICLHNRGGENVHSGYREDFSFSVCLTVKKTPNFSEKIFLKSLSMSYCAGTVLQRNLHMSSNNTE